MSKPRKHRRRRPYLRRGVFCLCCINPGAWARPLRSGNPSFLKGSELRLRERAHEADGWDGVEHAVDQIAGAFGEEYPA